MKMKKLIILLLASLLNAVSTQGMYTIAMQIGDYNTANERSFRSELSSDLKNAYSRA